MEYLCKYQVYGVEILQVSSAARTTHCDGGYGVTIATYSLPDLYLLKMKSAYLLLKSLTDFLVLVLCNVHISSHPLNKQEGQIALLEEEENSDFTF